MTITLFWINIVVFGQPNNFASSGNASIAQGNYLQSSYSYVQNPADAANTYTRFIISNYIYWDNTTSTWKVNADGSGGSAFAMLRQENNGKIGFFSRSSTGSPYDLSNNDLEAYRVFSILNNGNTGIGSNSPLCKLDVSGTARFFNTNAPVTGKGLEIDYNPSSDLARLLSYDRTNNIYRSLSVNGSSLMLNNISGGFVGIGTSNPESKVDITGSTTLGGLYDPSKAALKISSGGNMLIDGNEIYSDEKLQIGIAPNSALKIGSVNAITPFVTNMVINGDGNVGIGTTTPTEKLSVNGNIRTKKIVVSPGPWPDYVFDKDFKLLSLPDLEKFVNENKHLPGIPSAAAVAANGMDLGESQAAILEKVEELTLYLIEMKKENELLKERIKLLERKK